MERYDKEKKRLAEEKITQEKEAEKKRWSSLKIFLAFISVVVLAVFIVFVSSYVLPFNFVLLVIAALYGLAFLLLLIAAIIVFVFVINK